MVVVANGAPRARNTWRFSAFGSPIHAYPSPSSTDRAILIYNISIIINRRTSCNLLLREGRTNERIFLLFSSLFFLLFFLNGRNCNNEGEDQRSSTSFRLLWGKEGRGRWEEGGYVTESEELAERKRRNFFPLFFVLIAPGVRERGRVKARDG